jgi:DhnA family fructose-bisphosphate aldolase class Ia
MSGIVFRMNEFIDKSDQRSLIIDTSAGMALGPLPGLEDYSQAVRPLLSLADGVVCSPGQMRRLTNATRQDAGLLMRMDWTNTMRSADFVLPPEHARNFSIFSAQDALDFGATGMVISFLLGYEEEIEAACLKATVTLGLAGKDLGLPLVVEVRTSGPRVSLPGKAVELGASYALEGGADVIVVPYPGSASLKTIAEMVSVPWLVKPAGLEQAAEQMAEAITNGAAGVWLDHTLFVQPDPAAVLTMLGNQLHRVQTVR